MKINRLEKTKQNKQTNSDACEKFPNRDWTSKVQKLKYDLYFIAGLVIPKLSIVEISSIL